MPTLTSEAIEAALGAVIERANATGALCHEETIGRHRTFSVYDDRFLTGGVGDYASFVSLRPRKCIALITEDTLGQHAKWAQ